MKINKWKVEEWFGHKDCVRKDSESNTSKELEKKNWTTKERFNKQIEEIGIGEAS